VEEVTQRGYSLASIYVEFSSTAVNAVTAFFERIDLF